MKFDLRLVIGLFLLIFGILVEYIWRLNPIYNNYDNYGPGGLISVLGLIFLASRVRISRKLGIALITFLLLIIIFLCLYFWFR